jgi:hypothetical protein
MTQIRTTLMPVIRWSALVSAVVGIASTRSW